MSDFTVNPTPEQAEQFEGAKIVRVAALITFEAYSFTEISKFHAGTSLEARIAENIADAVGYRAGRAEDSTDGDALIAMTSTPDFAVDVRNIEVTVVDRPAELDHVVEMAQATSRSW